MILEQIDHQLLTGDFGPAARRAMQLLQKYAQVVGAKKFVGIESAHIDSCLYHGPSGLDFVNSFRDLDGRVRVPATLNVAAIDLVHPEYSQASFSLTAAQRSLTEAYLDLGCTHCLGRVQCHCFCQFMPGRKNGPLRRFH